jgi:hypothetical protein
MIYTSTSLLSLEAFCTAGELGPHFGGEGYNPILLEVRNRYRHSGGI